MLNDFNCACPVYVACGYTDLRRGIDGLAGIVQAQFQIDPFQRALFLFCGRRRDRLKALYWEGDGFVLLEDGSFQWPRRAEHPKEFLAGFKGYLHTDGYSGYHDLPESITVVGCWAHARRYFQEAVKSLSKKTVRQLGGHGSGLLHEALPGRSKTGGTAAGRTV